VESKKGSEVRAMGKKQEEMWEKLVEEGYFMMIEEAGPDVIDFDLNEWDAYGRNIKWETETIEAEITKRVELTLKYLGLLPKGAKVSSWLEVLNPILGGEDEDEGVEDYEAEFIVDIWLETTILAEAYAELRAYSNKKGEITRVDILNFTLRLEKDAIKELRKLVRKFGAETQE